MALYTTAPVTSASLGLGTMSTQSSSSVSITGGNISGVTGVMLSPYSAPAAASTFTQIGASGASLGDGTGVVRDTLLLSCNTAPGQFVSASAPGSTFSWIGAFEAVCQSGATVVAGLTVKETGSNTQTIRFGAYLSAGVWNVQVQRFTNVTTPGAVSLAGTDRFNYGSFGSVLWFKIEQTSTELVYNVSPNGTDWKIVYNEPKAGFITVAQVGVWSEVSAGTALVRIRSLALT